MFYCEKEKAVFEKITDSIAQDACTSASDACKARTLVTEDERMRMSLYLLHNEAKSLQHHLYDLYNQTSSDGNKKIVGYLSADIPRLLHTLNIACKHARLLASKLKSAEKQTQKKDGREAVSPMQLLYSDNRRRHPKLYVSVQQMKNLPVYSGSLHATQGNRFRILSKNYTDCKDLAERVFKDKIIIDEIIIDTKTRQYYFDTDFFDATIAYPALREKSGSGYYNALVKACDNLGCYGDV